MGSEAEWESHKSTIQHLYLSEDKPLTSVIEIMANSHGFNASKSRYERHFKVWGFRKNLKSHEWKAIHNRISKRKRVGKESELYVDGILVPTKKLRKETLRNSFVPSSEQHARGSSPEMPEQIIVRTPGALEADWFLTENLPWFLLESSLDFLVSQTLASATTTNLMLHPDRDDAAARGLRQAFAPHDNFHSTAHSREDKGLSMVYSMFEARGEVSTRSTQFISSKLFCIMPELRVGEHLASSRKILGPLNQDATLQLIKLTIYSLSNKLLREWTEAEHKVVRWLYREENIHYLEVLLSNKGPATEGLSEALFQGAIKAEDIQLTQILIRTGLNPNEQVIDSDFQLYTPLQYASQKGNAQLARILLSAGVDVNAKERLSTAWCGQTPLELAAAAGVKDVINLLLDAGAEVNGSNHSSALQIATEYGHSECAQILLSAGAGVDAIDNDGRTVLHTAAGKENVELVKALVAAGADVNAIADNDQTVLEVAAESHSAEIVVILLNTGVEEFGHALYYAVEDGNKELVRTLLHAGADANCTSIDGETALTDAAAQGDIEMVKLLNAGANVNGEIMKDFDKHETLTPLQAAAQKENPEVAQMLLDAGALVNASAASGQVICRSFAGTALQVAAYHGNVQISRILLNVGADVNRAPAEAGSTALQAAVESQNVLLVQMMLDAGANANGPPDDEGRTALQSAIEGKNHLIIQLLLNAGADVNAPATAIRARTPLQLAIERKTQWLIQYLLKAGADIDGLPAKKHGTTALNAAIRTKDNKLVHSLLNAGADVNNPAAKLWGETALETAVANNDTHLVQNLLDIGADTDDPAALLMAVENRNVELIQVLLAAHVGVHGLRRKSYGSIALQAAAKNEDYGIVRILLNAGVDVNTRASGHRNLTNSLCFGWGIGCNCQWIDNIEYGAPALAWAVGTGNLAIARLLLEAGADPSIESPMQKGLYDATALSTAVGQGNTPIAKMLIEAGADPNAEFEYSGSSNTALLRAVYLGNSQMVKVLLEAGANVNAAVVNVYRRNPLQLAAEKGCIELVEMFLAAGADVNAPASEAGGATALQAAAISGYFGIVCLLLKAEAYVNAAPAKRDGRTALEGAAEHGHIDILQLLLDSGASIEGAGRGQYDRAIKFATEHGHNAVRRLL